MRARERAGFSIENRGARRSVARCSGKGSRVVAIGVDCRLMRAMAFIIAGVISCGAMSFRRRLVSACGARTSLEGADEVDACFLFADDDPIAAQCRDKQGCRRRGRRRPLFARAPLAPRIGLGPVQSSLVKPSLACPFPTLPLPLSLLLTSPQLGLAGLMHGGVYSCASGWQVRLAPPAEDLQRSPSRSQPANQSLGHCGGCCFDTYVQMHERRFLT